jgi:hypothetical protein
MIAAFDSLASLRIGERPRWVRPLLALGAIVFIAKLTGAFEVPDSLLGLALAVEIVVVAFELAITFAVIRHFYGQHRSSGLDRGDAWVESQLDEIRAAGFPESLVGPLGRVMRWEMRMYRRIGRFLFRRSK